MKLITAYKVLEKECDFLGVDWEKLMKLFIECPAIFPQRSQEAYDRVMEDRMPA